MELTSILIVLSIVLSMYTARLVCNDPKYDNLGSTMQSLRSFAGCKSSSASSVQTQQHVKKQQEDPALPSWAKQAATLEPEMWPYWGKAENYNHDVLHNIARSRTPKLFQKAPIKVFRDIEQSYSLALEDPENPDIAKFWQLPARTKMRRGTSKATKNVFAREVYNASIRVEGVSFPSASTSPTHGGGKDEADATLTSPYYEFRDRDLLEFVRSSVVNEVVGVGEYVVKDLFTFAEVPMEMFRVHMIDDVEEGTGNEEGRSFQNDTTVFSTLLETAYASMAAIYTPAHSLQLQFNGRRKILLFPPERFFEMQMYPVVNPRRRQSMLDFKDSAKTATPIPCIVAELNAGDALYVPPFWTVRTTVLTAGETNLPSDFSFSATATSVSFEQHIQTIVEQMSKIEQTVTVVSHMASAPESFKEPSDRTRAAVSLFVRALYSKMGMDVKRSVQSLLERFTSPAELQADMKVETAKTARCLTPTRASELETEAAKVVSELADAIAQSRSMIAGSYDRLDKRYGSESNRVTAVWRIIVEDFVERLVVKIGKASFVELTQCILDDVQSKVA